MSAYTSIAWRDGPEVLHDGYISSSDETFTKETTSSYDGRKFKKELNYDVNYLREWGCKEGFRESYQNWFV